jgi:hypothetical protein
MQAHVMFKYNYALQGGSFPQNYGKELYAVENTGMEGRRRSPQKGRCRKVVAERCVERLVQRLGRGEVR